jgi:predicted unusual protein kinase regulating ubiquinone biosynthesis (AarF/ABC1/UbiB family)
MWSDGRLYFLDLGMVGEVPAGLREDLLLLLLALWRGDEEFLAEMALALAGTGVPRDLDLPAFRSDIGAVMARARTASLRDVELGPLLQDMADSSLRHGVRLPSSLLLTGKALAQIQLAASTLDPELDPFAIGGSFLTRNWTDRVRRAIDPQQLLYEAHKFRMRAMRTLDALERLMGAMPGPNLQVEFHGVEGLDATVRRAGRRVAIALAVAGALVATAISAASDEVGAAVTRTFALLSVVLVTLFVVEGFRRR